MSKVEIDRRSPCMDCTEGLCEPVNPNVCPCPRLTQWVQLPKNGTDAKQLMRGK